MPPYHRDQMPLLPPSAPQSPASHAHRGLPWERRLDDQHALYRRAGWYVRRQHVATVAQGGGLAKIIGNAPPDYLLAKHGIWIVADAKSWSSGGRWPLEQIADHLARDLSEATEGGGVAGIILDYGGVGWWLPWCELRGRWERWAQTAGRAGGGAASLGEAELMEVGERFEGTDWLSVAVR